MTHFRMLSHVCIIYWRIRTKAYFFVRKETHYSESATKSPMNHTQMTQYTKRSPAFVDLDQSETRFSLGPLTQEILKIWNTFVSLTPISHSTILIMFSNQKKYDLRKCLQMGPFQPFGPLWGNNQGERRRNSLPIPECLCDRCRTLQSVKKYPF